MAQRLLLLSGMDKSAANRSEPIRRLDIVVADDARAQRLLLYSLLSSSGHRIRVATSGETALQMAAESPPDLLITDLEMPGGDGFGLIDAIRHADDLRLRGIPIIVCSSCGESYYLNRALDSGANSFVTKPLHQNELQLAIINLPITSSESQPYS